MKSYRQTYAQIEPLEMRRLLDAALPPWATLSPEGVLVLWGTRGADQFTVSAQENELQVARGEESFTLAADSVTSLIARLGAGHDKFTSTLALPTRVNGGIGCDTIFTADGDDTIVGNYGADRIETWGGADLILGGNGPDTISAGTGNDTVYAGQGNDSVQGGEGDDKLEGNPGQDTLEGGTGTNVLRGNGGPDRILSDSSSDRIRGGVAMDYFETNGARPRDLNFFSNIPPIPTTTSGGLIGTTFHVEMVWHRPIRTITLDTSNNAALANTSLITWSTTTPLEAITIDPSIYTIYPVHPSEIVWNAQAVTTTFDTNVGSVTCASGGTLTLSVTAFTGNAVKLANMHVSASTPKEGLSSELRTAIEAFEQDGTATCVLMQRTWSISKDAIGWLFTPAESETAETGDPLATE